MYMHRERERERRGRERVVIYIIYIMYREITVKETTDLKNIFNSRLYQFICVAKNTERQTMCPPGYLLLMRLWPHDNSWIYVYGAWLHHVHHAYMGTMIMMIFCSKLKIFVTGNSGYLSFRCICYSGSYRAFCLSIFLFLNFVK